MSFSPNFANLAVVGLGDINFDPSLQTDEVDHDFFDNPVNTDFEVVQQNNVVEEQTQSPFRRLEECPTTSSTDEQNIQVSLSPSPLPTSEPACTFSTGTLLASLNHSQNELNDLNDGKQENATKHRHQGHSNNESYTSHNTKKRTKCSETRIKLFDLSDSSSEDGSQESDEELNNFMQKYHDFLDVGDSDVSDITEVSPMSSLAVSPFGMEHQYSDDSNHSTGIPSANLLSIAQQNQHMISTSAELYNNSDQSESIPVIRSSTTTSTTNNLLKPTPIKMISADLPTKTSFMGVFDDENKDQNQNGERSPSNSSCISSACGSANSTRNTCSSSMSFSLSSSATSPSRRSACSSSASSSSSFVGHRSKTVRNHSFTPDQLKRIERENGILLKKILDTQRHHHHHHHNHHHTSGVRGSRTQSKSLAQCSASIIRRQQQRRIDYENGLLMKRLQSVKPSKEIEDAFKANNNV